ncbi:transferrin receptor protein 1-like [Aplochiton taeniatus]
MDQARSTISKIFNGEPRSYTRFNLTQNMEGGESQVEMKLSSDMDPDEDVGGGNGVNHHALGGDPYKVRPARHQTPRNLFFMAFTTLLIFIIGYLIGYLVHRKKEAAPVSGGCDPPVAEEQQAFLDAAMAAPIMDWSDVKALLARKLSPERFDDAFGEFSSDSHQAGSRGDELLAGMVLAKLKGFGLNTWTDQHFVKVQDPSASARNKVSFKGSEVGRTSGFLSYSATGNATGALLYGYYGQARDLQLLQDKNINLTGRVLLLRAGKISFAEKVANAAKMKAAAVLIYPDPSDYSIGEDTDLYGHVHLGSGDPYSPGFPSFNHTQFPPVQSSGLPSIPAQTITAKMALIMRRQLGGLGVPAEWGGMTKLGEEGDLVTMEVNNVLTEKKIHNVFGVIKGFVDPDRFVILGAQRDAWGPGFAKSTVGTSILVELARAITSMVEDDGFKPRRSIVFASWTAGEYGSIGATEWLEGYLSSLNMKAFSYINLDGVVTGRNGFKASASPMMYNLLGSTLKEVPKLGDPGKTLYDDLKVNWETQVLEPLRMDDPAYPFVTFSGIPAVSFRFTSNPDYQYYGTLLDTRDKLQMATSNQTPQLAVMAAKVAGHMTLRLVHDHLLRLDAQKYTSVLRSHVVEINRKVMTLKRLHQLQPSVLPDSLTVQWLMSALGSYGRAARGLTSDIQNSDLEDVEMCRTLNDRIMKVERDFLSPYVSARETPFRHILIGSGSHTLKALSEHLEDLKTSEPGADADLFRNQFALATWTIQGCANTLGGEIWSMENEI